VPKLFLWLFAKAGMTELKACPLCEAFFLGVRQKHLEEWGDFSDATALLFCDQHARFVILL
jgi:hypothetical protein